MYKNICVKVINLILAFILLKVILPNCNSVNHGEQIAVVINQNFYFLHPVFSVVWASNNHTRKLNLVMRTQTGFQIASKLLPGTYHWSHQ